MDESLSKVRTKSTVPFIVLTGDFNCSKTTWPKTDSEMPIAGNHHGNHLLAICDEFHLKQMTKEPTRVTETTESILDLVLTNLPSKISSCEVIPGVSDHDVVLTFVVSVIGPSLHPSSLL